MQLHIIEGNTQKLDGGAMFGNAPKALWSRWVETDEANRIDLSCRCLLMIKDDGTKVLFETGVGDFFEPKLKDRYGVNESGHKLLDNLRECGFDHTDIDYVVLSHLHFDHAGGLLSSFEEGEGLKLLFPKAKYVVGKQHWEHALKPHFRDKASFLPELNQMLEQSGRLILIEGNDIEGHRDSEANDVISGVNFLFSQGHTPGLMLSEIVTEHGNLVFTSDLIPGQYWVHLPICMGYDRYPEALIDEKQTLLTRIEEQGGRLFFTHDATMPCASVKKDERGRFSAESAQL